jgi:hypothetical protein
MNANLQAYFQFLRLRPIVSSGLYWISMFWLCFKTNPFGLAVALLAPVVIGYALADGTHELLHCPHVVLLPGGRRRFFVWHGLTIATVALVWAGAVRLVGGDLPMPAMSFLSLAGLSLALPLEPAWRWFGSRALCLTLLGLLAVAGFVATEMHADIVAAPWLASAVGAGITAGCFALASSPARLRARVVVRFTAQAGSQADELTMNWRAKGAIAQTSRTGRSWQHGPVGDSTLKWLRAMMHERYGFQRGGWPLVVLALSLGLFGLGLLCTGVTEPAATEPLAARIYFALCEPQRLTHGFAMSWNMSWVFLIATTFLAYPKPNLYLPVARAQRSRIAHLFALLSVTTLLVGIAVTAGVSAWVASRFAGVAFKPSALPAPLIAMLATLPVLPFVQYGELPGVEKIAGVMGFVSEGSGLILGAALGFLACLFPANFFSPAGLTVYVAIVVAGQIVFHWALRRYYRRCDLIQRGAGQ